MSPLLPISSKQSPVRSSGCSLRDGISRRGSAANRNIQILLQTKLLMMEETRSHLAQDDAIVLSIPYFIMRWVLLPSHPGISIQQKEETRNLPSQGNFLQYHSLPLIVSRDNVHLTSHHSWLYILILMKDSFYSSVYPLRRSSVPTHSVQISTLALSPPETLADKHSSQESATHLNSFIFIGQAWNNCFSLRKPLQPWPQLMDQSTSGPNPWLATKSF